MSLGLLLLTAPMARAITLRFSAGSLERTLDKKLFTAEGGRYYLRGNTGGACFVYAEKPRVSFAGDRVVVHVTTHAKLGTSMHGSCLGVGLNADSEISMLPEAEGDTIGFRDVHIDRLSDNRELNFLLEPFLGRRLPQQLKISASQLLRAMLSNSMQTTGYDLTLESLKIHSMQVQDNSLVVDLDGHMSVK
jgi:hypothetical protein